MFTDKICLITGASAGLGRALAIKMAGNNANVALLSRNTAKMQETATLCNHSPLTITGDITSESDCKDAIDRVISHYGRLDYLVLNAGVSMWSRFDALPDVSVIRQLMETNYMGAVNCTRHALPYLKKTKGMITVISSIQGKMGVPWHTGYAASKHALEGFFNSLRMELENVDILLVSPGWIKGTELKQHALGRQEKYGTQTDSKHHKQAMDVETCCNEIIAAMRKRKRELILPKKYRWLPLLKWAAPEFLERIIKSRL